MNVFVAGGTGTIGRPLVLALRAAGHLVTVLTRAPGRRAEVEALGARALVANALDGEALMAAVRSAQPTHVIHQLTALPKAGPRRAKDLEDTNRLRIDGTRNLLRAAIAAGAERFVAGSFALLAPRDAADEMQGAAAAAVRSLETQVLEATRQGSIEGVVLRYGMFYGPETPSTAAMIALVRKRRLPVVRGDSGLLPVVHVDDAVSATVRALSGGFPGSLYDIVDDRAVSLTDIVETIAEYTHSARPLRVPGWMPRLFAPYMTRMTSIRLPLSNARAKAELGWTLKYPTIREGLARMCPQAA